ncbi:PAS domain-containing protein [Streptomyces qinglanensis]|uniref:PAS domain-containing protein n=1 Tax=Streptomyces qinglanensis TaxID=943816 RepID=UPI000B332653|nr:PAS domain-containing protein [Streptomyces qinglanensis]
MSSRPSRGAARLAAILDALPDALLLVNCNGTVVNANAIALETLETPGTALVGRGLLDLLPEFDSKRIPGSMRRPDEAEQSQERQKPTRMVARRTDGSEFPVEVTSANLEDGRTPYASAIEAAFADNPGGGYTGDELLMLVVRDLTGTLDTEAELARQQRQTEMILRAASEGVVGVDSEGRVVLVNPSAAQILGYRASDLGGQELHPLVHHSRPDGTPLPFEETPLADSLRSGRKHRVRAGQVLWAKDGRAVPVDMTTAPVRDGEQLVGAVLTFTDRRPYDAVAERQAQLRAVLEESLRGPLEQLRQELSGLSSDPAAQLWPEANQILHHLSAGYARMTTLVDNVLGYQRLDSGQERLRTEPVPMDAVVSAGVEGATELIGPGRAQFAVHAPPIEAEVDPERLAVALAHLIADVAGVDATGRAQAAPPPGADPTIVVAAAQRGEVVRIEVRGPYSGGSPVHEPLVRGIVARHGGVLQTHEVPGSAGGSAYVLEVPVKAVGDTARQSGSRARRGGPADTDGSGTGDGQGGTSGAGRAAGGGHAAGGDSTGGGAHGRSGSHARGGGRARGGASHGGEAGAFGMPGVLPGAEHGETTVMPVPAAPARGVVGQAPEGTARSGPPAALPAPIERPGAQGQGQGDSTSAAALEPVTDPRQARTGLAQVPDPRQSMELTAGPGPSAPGGAPGSAPGAVPPALGPAPSPGGARPDAGNTQPGAGGAQSDAGGSPEAGPVEGLSAVPGRPVAPVPAQRPHQQDPHDDGSGSPPDMPRPTGRRRGRPSPAEEQLAQPPYEGGSGPDGGSGALELPAGAPSGSTSVPVAAQGTGRRARRALGERTETAPGPQDVAEAQAATEAGGVVPELPGQRELPGQPGPQDTSGAGAEETAGGPELSAADGGRRARRIAAARARAEAAEAEAQQAPRHAPFALPPAASEAGPVSPVQGTGAEPGIGSGTDADAGRLPSGAPAEAAGGGTTPPPGSLPGLPGSLPGLPGAAPGSVPGPFPAPGAEPGAAADDPAYAPHPAPPAPDGGGPGAPPQAVPGRWAAPGAGAPEAAGPEAAGHDGSVPPPGGLPADGGVPAGGPPDMGGAADAPDPREETGEPRRGDSSVVAASPILGGGALPDQQQAGAPQAHAPSSRPEQGQPGETGSYETGPGPRVRTLGQGVPFAERMAEQSAAQAQQWPPGQHSTPSAMSAIPSTPSTPAAPAGSGRRRKLATPEERTQGTPAPGTQGGAPAGAPRSGGPTGAPQGGAGSSAEAPHGLPRPDAAPGQGRAWPGLPGQAQAQGQTQAPGQARPQPHGQVPPQGQPGATPGPMPLPQPQAGPPGAPGAPASGRPVPDQAQGQLQGGQAQGRHGGPQEFAVGGPDGGPGAELAEGPEPLDGPDSPVEVTDGRGFGVPPHAMDDELPPEPLDNPRRLLVWPEPDVSTQQALSDRGYRPVLVHSREEVDAQIAAYPAALFVDPLTGPITRTALQSLRTAAVAAEVPVLVTAGLGQATREAAYGADPAVLLKALAPRDSEQHPPRVLLVEEEQAIAAAFAATLERRGMQVAHAPTDAEAVQVAAQVRPNLVVMDLMQVRRRRAGIIDWLRVNGILNRTPFVVYTSAGLDPDELPRLASGETVLFLAERSTSAEVQARIVDLLTKIGAN